MSALAKGQAYGAMLKASQQVTGKAVSIYDATLCAIVAVGLGHVVDALLEIRDVLDDIRQGNR